MPARGAPLSTELPARSRTKPRRPARATVGRKVRSIAAVSTAAIRGTPRRRSQPLRCLPSRTRLRSAPDRTVRLNFHDCPDSDLRSLVASTLGPSNRFPNAPVPARDDGGSRRRITTGRPSVPNPPGPATCMASLLRRFGLTTTRRESPVRDADHLLSRGSFRTPRDGLSRVLDSPDPSGPWAQSVQFGRSDRPEIHLGATKILNRPAFARFAQRSCSGCEQRPIDCAQS